MESEVVYETLVSPTDLTPVLEALEMMQQSLDKTNVSLEQLHVDASLAFLAVVLLIGVILAAQSDHDGEETVFVISLEIMDAVPEVFAIGMTSACFVVLVAGLLVSCFKAIIKIMGR